MVNLLLIFNEISDCEEFIYTLKNTENYQAIALIKSRSEIIKFVNSPEAKKIDVALIDNRFVGMDGNEFSRMVNEKELRIKTIITLKKDDLAEKEMIKNGIQGYIFGDSKRNDFFNAIDSVMIGRKFKAVFENGE